MKYLYMCHETDATPADHDTLTTIFSYIKI